MATAVQPTSALYGPLLVGAFLSTLFYGITIVQFYNYFTASKRDPLWMKALVFYLFVAATLDSFFNAAIAYQPLVTGFGNLTDQVPIYLCADGALTVAISTPIQMFMAWRIMILTESRWLGGFIMFLSAISGVGGIWTTISLSLNPHWSFLPHIRAPPTLWLLTTAIVDIMITVSLVYSLSKKKTGLGIMDNYVSHIIRLTIQTGVFTAVAAVADMSVFLAVQHTTIFFIWDLSLAKFYVNSMMSSLNARTTFREARNALFSPNLTEVVSAGLEGSVNMLSPIKGQNPFNLRINTRSTYHENAPHGNNVQFQSYNPYVAKRPDLETGDRISDSYKGPTGIESPVNQQNGMRTPRTHFDQWSGRQE